ncbi:MAG: hypothetical protein ACOX4W_06425 [Bacilli bacterium]
METIKIISHYFTFIVFIILIINILNEIANFYEEKKYSFIGYLEIFKRFYLLDKTNILLVFQVVLSFFIKYWYIELVIGILALTTFIIKRIFKKSLLKYNFRRSVIYFVLVVVYSILGTLFSLVIDFYSLNVLLLGVVVSLPVGFVYGILVDKLFNKKNKKKDGV